MNKGFPGVSVVKKKKKKNPPANAADAGSAPGLGRSPGGRNGNPLQYPCLGNPMDRGAWGAMVHRVMKELDMEEQLNNSNKQETINYSLIVPFWFFKRSLKWHYISTNACQRFRLISANNKMRQF